MKPNFTTQRLKQIEFALFMVTQNMQRTFDTTLPPSTALVELDKDYLTSLHQINNCPEWPAHLQPLANEVNRRIIAAFQNIVARKTQSTRVSTKETKHGSLTFDKETLIWLIENHTSHIRPLLEDLTHSPYAEMAAALRLFADCFDDPTQDMFDVLQTAARDGALPYDLTGIMFERLEKMTEARETDEEHFTENETLRFYQKLCQALD